MCAGQIGEVAMDGCESVPLGLWTKEHSKIG